MTSDEINATILEMRGRSEKWAAIAKVVGIGERAVHARGQRLGLVKNHKAVTPRRLVDRDGNDIEERRQQIICLARSGVYPKQIAERVGLHFDSVYRTLRRARAAGEVGPLPQQPREPKPAEPTRPDHRAAITLSARMTHHKLAMTPDLVAKRANAYAHAKRVAVLPPISQAEADDLIARHLRERGATVCPARCCAAVNNNEGLL